MTGVRKNAICMTLPTIGPTACPRNRAQTTPSNRHTASPSIAKEPVRAQPARRTSRADRIDDRDRDNHNDVVREDEQIANHGAEGMHGKRHTDRADHIIRLREANARVVSPDRR